MIYEQILLRFVSFFGLLFFLILHGTSDASFNSKPFAFSDFS